MSYSTGQSRLGTLGHYINGDKRVNRDIHTGDPIYSQPQSLRSRNLENTMFSSTTTKRLFGRDMLSQVLEPPSAWNSVTNIGRKGYAPDTHVAFGWDVDICSRYAIVGDPLANDSGLGVTYGRMGAAYVYDLNATNASTQTNSLSNDIPFMTLTRDVGTNNSSHRSNMYYGRAVAIGHHRAVVAYSNAGIGSQLSDLKYDGIDIYDINRDNGTFVRSVQVGLTNSNQDAYQYFPSDQMLHISRNEVQELQYGTSPFHNNIRIVNFGGGIAIGENAIFVTCDVQIDNGQDQFFGGLMTLDMNGKFLNFDIAFNAFGSGRSTNPPCTGGSHNNFKNWPSGNANANNPSGESGRVKPYPVPYSSTDTNRGWGPNKGISVGSERVVVGLPAYSGGNTVYGNYGLVAYFDLNGNFVNFSSSGDLNNPSDQSDWSGNHRGASVSTSMGMLGHGRGWITNSSSQPTARAEFYHDNMKRTEILQPEGALFQQNSSNVAYNGDDAAGSVDVNFSTPGGSNLDANAAGMTVFQASGYRLVITGYANSANKRYRLQKLDEHGYPIREIVEWLPQNYWPDGSSIYRLGDFSKLRYSNGKVITNSNLYHRDGTSAGYDTPHNKVAVFHWPMETHSLDMFDHLR